MTLRQRLAGGITAVLKPFGIRLVVDRPLRSSAALLRLKAEETGVRTFLDVGANQGQFASHLLGAGWNGRIVSFEPTSGAHAILAARAARHGGRWTAAPRMAIGAVEGEAEINVAINSMSSSLLKVDRRSTDVAPASGFAATERVSVRPLDSLIEPDWEGPFGLKIDTQGFEMEVLKGADATLARTNVLSLELSLFELYEGGARFGEVFARMEQAGFRCISLIEVFSDFARNEMLQVDGIFLRTNPVDAAGPPPAQ